MPTSGDIAVLQYGNDAKWHWQFLTPGSLSTFTFQSGSAPTLTAIGGAIGNVPQVPVPMSAMSNPVKATIDAITAQGGPTWIAALATQDYVASQVAVLTSGSPSQLNTFLEAYNRFLSDESAASALNTALATESSARASADTALTATVATKQASANKMTSTLDFGHPLGEGDTASLTVSAPWVASESRIICLPSPAASADHSTDESLVEDIHFSAVNLVPGVSFDVVAHAPNGTWGRHDCTILSL